MVLKNCTLERFKEIISEKRLFCFGASIMPYEICEEYPELRFEERIIAFVDNAKEKQGTTFQLNNRVIPVISAGQLAEEIQEEDILLITSKYYVQIYEQLDGITQLDNKCCYIWPAIAPQYKTDKNLKMKIKKCSSREEKIPKKIHYCWFGKAELPELEQKCIDSWSKVCPDYEIVCWNESNYDVYKNRYMQEAYDSKKWAFVPDYARLDIIYQYGGIYLDTDVEIIRPFDDLLVLEGFIGFESKNLCAMGLGFGAKRGHALLNKLLESYNDRNFKRLDGSLDVTASPFIQTEVLVKNGLKLNNQLQKVDDMIVLPAECLSPDNNMIPHVTENTYSIHHFAGSWTTDDNREALIQNRQFAQSLQLNN